MLLGVTGSKINILETFPSLCRTLEISRDVCDCHCDGSYNSFELKKFGARRGRVIEAPCPHLKFLQRTLLDKLLVHVTPHDAAMAFVRGRSIAINARRHLGASHLFMTDIRSFFSSVKTEHIEEMLRLRYAHFSQDFREEILGLVTMSGQLPQGAPTSPHVANLTMFGFDELCQEAADRCDAVYTRYADDISVSSNDATSLRKMENVVKMGLAAFDMELHSEKTRHLGPRQTKLVTGLDIGGSKIRPTRAFRKKTAALVRMAEKYPEKMELHRDTIRGYLSFWYDVDSADMELANLLERMDRPKWAQKVRAASNEENLVSFRERLETLRQRYGPNFNFPFEIPHPHNFSGERHSRDNDTPWSNGPRKR